MALHALDPSHQHLVRKLALRLPLRSEPRTFSPSLLYYAIFIAIATGWLFKPEWRKWKLTTLFVLAIWCGQWILHHHSITRLTVLPLNGGSAIYFNAPGSKDDLLLDCGNEDSFDFITKPYLRAQGVNSLPAVALTVGDDPANRRIYKFADSVPGEKSLHQPR